MLPIIIPSAPRQKIGEVLYVCMMLLEVSEKGVREMSMKGTYSLRCLCLAISNLPELGWYVVNIRAAIANVEIAQNPNLSRGIAIKICRQMNEIGVVAERP